MVTRARVEMKLVVESKVGWMVLDCQKSIAKSCQGASAKIVIGKRGPSRHKVENKEHKEQQQNIARIVYASGSVFCV